MLHYTLFCVIHSRSVLFLFLFLFYYVLLIEDNAITFMLHYTSIYFVFVLSVEDNAMTSAFCFLSFRLLFIVVSFCSFLFTFTPQVLFLFVFCFSYSHLYMYLSIHFVIQMWNKEKVNPFDYCFCSIYTLLCYYCIVCISAI